MIRNGAAFDDYAHIPTLGKNPNDELYAIHQPIVGYIGAISHWFDFNLVHNIAIKLPDVSFVYIGRIASEYKKVTDQLSTIHNIYFLGERPYYVLQDYLKYFSLAQIPFKINELVKSVNPIKLYEYLAAGLRVISSPLPEVQLYTKENIVVTPSSINQYSACIESFLEKDGKNYVDKCQKFALEHTWSARVEEAMKILQSKMLEKKK